MIKYLQPVLKIIGGDFYCVYFLKYRKLVITFNEKTYYYAFHSVKKFVNGFSQLHIFLSTLRYIENQNNVS